MGFQVKEPILVVGLGGAGSRLAALAGDRLGADVMAVSNDRRDLQAETSIEVSTAPVVNPSVQLIRGSSYRVYDEIRAKVSGYSTVVLMANLAGRAGAALAPVVSQACREEGRGTVSFAIMPFGYEKGRIFNSGIALKRLRENSGCTVVLDNDALLESNPSLSPNSCFGIANRAILHVVGSLGTSDMDPGTSILATGAKSPDVEESLRDSLKVLYDGAPPGSVRRSMLYVAGGNDIPAGVLRSVSSIAGGVLGGSGSRVEMESAPEEADVVMLSAVQGMTKFDGYDPLGAIPQENTLDWSEPEVSVDCELGLYQLE